MGMGMGMGMEIVGLGRVTPSDGNVLIMGHLGYGFGDGIGADLSRITDGDDCTLWRQMHFSRFQSSQIISIV